MSLLQKVINIPNILIPCISQIILWHISYLRLPTASRQNPDACNRLMVQCCRNILKQVYQVQFEGLSHIVEKRATLYVMRHASEIDFLIVGAIHGKCRYITKPGLLKHPGIGFMTEKGQHIVVDTKCPVSRQQAKDKMKQCLQQGWSVFVLPEGRLSRTQKLQSFHTSSLEIACALQIPVVTITLSNAPPCIWQIPRQPLHVTFHVPMRYQNVSDAISHIRDLMLKHTHWPRHMQNNPVTLHRIVAVCFLVLSLLSVFLKKWVWALVFFSAAVVLSTSK